MKVFNSILTIALNEGLIRTEEINNTIKILRNSYPDAQITRYMESIEISLLTDNLDRSKIESFLKLINNLGWYPSGYYAKSEWQKFTRDGFIRDIQNFRRVDLIIEKKYDREFKKQDIFYHATKLKYAHKIEKIGLTPRAKSKKGYHPERIYLAISYDAAYDILGLLYDHDEYSDPNWVIYEIDVSNIPNFKTMVDPNFDGGVYTTQNIPPSAIKRFKILDLSK